MKTTEATEATESRKDWCVGLSMAFMFTLTVIGILEAVTFGNKFLDKDTSPEGKEVAKYGLIVSGATIFSMAFCFCCLFKFCLLPRVSTAREATFSEKDKSAVHIELPVPAVDVAISKGYVAFNGNGK